MITKSNSVKLYRSAHDRFLKPRITNFLVHELRYLGPITAANVADELIRIRAFSTIWGQLLHTRILSFTSTLSKKSNKHYRSRNEPFSAGS
jgi:hypothetical protein